MPRLPIALQLYTVRDAAEKDYLGTLRQVAQIGYANVELAGTYGLSPRELRQVLDDVGLTVISNHAPLDLLEQDLAGVIEANQTLGNRHIIVPYLPEPRRKTLDDWRQVAEAFNRFGRELKKAGMYFGYHNHAFEFEMFDGKAALDWLYEWTDPEYVKAEIDTYWVQYGGQDPAAYLRKYAARIAFVHIKDMEPGPERMFAEIGEGILNWPAIFEAAEAGTARGYIVEQDRWRRPSIESARLSFENLKKMGKA